MKAAQTGTKLLIIAIVVVIIGLIAVFIGSKEEEINNQEPTTPLVVSPVATSSDPTESTSPVDTENPGQDTDPTPALQVEDEQPFVALSDPDPDPTLPSANNEIVGDPELEESEGQEAELIVGACGIVIESIIPDQAVSFPLTIDGRIDNSDLEAECEWQLKNDTAGFAELFFLDENVEAEEGEWKVLGSTTDIVVEDDSVATTTFSVVVDFDNEGIGLPNGTLLKVVFDEDNDSLVYPSDTFELPIVLNANLGAPYSCGFRVTSTSQDDIVNFPATISGDIDNTESVAGCIWEMSEVQAGMAQLYFQSGDEWNLLGTSTPITAANWQATSTMFSAVIEFNNEGIGLPLGSELKVVFTEENAASTGFIDTFELPIVLGTSNSDEE